MEEPVSWKAHGFTLFVFGGIVAVCSVFFVLGMLAGRAQERRIARTSLNEEAQKPAAGSQTDNLKLNFYSETSGEDPRLMQEPLPRSSAPAEAAAPAASQGTSSPSAGEKYIQILATPDRKRAQSELKKVQSKGFQAMIIDATDADHVTWHRIWVGPYPESKVALATADLRAAGYDKVIVR